MIVLFPYPYHLIALLACIIVVISACTVSDCDSFCSSVEDADSPIELSFTQSTSSAYAVVAMTKFENDHGEMMLKSGKSVEFALTRPFSRYDSDGKKHTDPQYQYRFRSEVEGTLKLKSKDPIIIYVDDGDIKSGISIFDDGLPIINTGKGKSYAILNKGKHEITVKANDELISGKIILRVQKVEISEKIAKKYRVINASVKASDANDLCELFGGSLADLEVGQFGSLLEISQNLAVDKITQVWSSSVASDAITPIQSVIPSVFGFEKGILNFDPENVFEKLSEYEAKKLAELPSKSDKNYKTALQKLRTGLKTIAQIYLDYHDETIPRAVLCKKCASSSKSDWSKRSFYQTPPPYPDIYRAAILTNDLGLFDRLIVKHLEAENKDIYVMNSVDKDNKLACEYIESEDMKRLVLQRYLTELKSITGYKSQKNLQHSDFWKYKLIENFTKLFPVSDESERLAEDPILLNIFKVALAGYFYELIYQVLKVAPFIRSKRGRTIFHVSMAKDNLKLLSNIPINLNYSDTIDYSNKLPIDLAHSKEAIEFMYKRFIIEQPRLSSVSNNYFNVLWSLAFKAYKYDLPLIFDDLKQILKSDFKNEIEKNLIEALNHPESESDYETAAFILNIDPLTKVKEGTLLYYAAIQGDVTLFIAILSSGVKLSEFFIDGDDATDFLDNFCSHSMLNSFLLQEAHENYKYIYKFPLERKAKLEYIDKMKMYGLKYSLLNRMIMIKNGVRATGSQFFFHVNRLNLLESSILYYEEHFEFSWYNSYYYPRIKIQFQDENGIDVGGLTNEWLSLLIESFFKPNPDGRADLFTLPLFHMANEESGVYAPNKEYPPEVYKFAGSILALAFNHKIGIKVEFIESIYRAIWRIEPVRIEYMKSNFPKAAINLEKLKHLGDISTLELDLYTGQSTEQYIEDYSHYLLYNKYKEEIEALADGFSVERNEELRGFLWIPEFKQVLKGKVSFTAEEFMSAATFEYGSDHLKSILMEIIEEFSDEERMLLIKFMASRNSLPHDGLAGIQPQLTVIFNYNLKGKLPTAATCSSILYLPEFDTKEELKKNLLIAINLGGDFGII